MEIIVIIAASGILFVLIAARILYRVWTVELYGNGEAQTKNGESGGLSDEG